jgi:hypothetical protein
MKTPITRRLAWTMLPLAVVVAIAVWMIRGRATEPQPSPVVPDLSAFVGNFKSGDEIYAVDPDIVTGVDFETPARTFVATRPKGLGELFSIEIRDRATGRVEHCRSRFTLESVLGAVSSVRVRRVLPARDAWALWTRYGAAVRRLRIRDTIDTEPKEFGVLLTDGDAQSAIFREGPNFFEPSFASDVLALLSSDCAALESDGSQPY